MSEMNEKEIKRRFEAISKFEISPEATARDLEKTKQRLTKLTSKPQQSGHNIWRNIMLSKMKYKVAALLGCIILVSAAAAITIPGVYKTIKTFITALDEKNITEIIELANPMSAIPQQIDDINKIADESKIKLACLYADDNNAIAFTNDVIVINDESDRSQDQKGPLVITLTKKENMWIVIDIDLENEETIKTELERFLEYHPTAIEINVD